MSRHAVPKSSGSALHPRRAFKVAYILPSSVCSKSLVFHSYENCRGVLSFFPFWNSSLATHHSTPSPLECGLTKTRSGNSFRMRSRASDEDASPERASRPKDLSAKRKRFRMRTSTISPSKFFRMRSYEKRWGRGVSSIPHFRFSIFQFPGCALVHFFGDGFGLEEQQQIVFSAGLGVGAGHVEPAEGMRADHRAGALAVQIQIPDVEHFFGLADLFGILRVHRAGQAKLRVVGNRERVVVILRLDDREHGTKHFLLRQPRFRRHVRDNRRLDEISIARRALSARDKPSILLPYLDVVQNGLHRR